MTFWGQLRVVFCAAAAAVLLSASPAPRLATPGPNLIVWAWERPEDLRFIDPHATAVAPLAQTITLAGEKISIHPRMQPLYVPPGTAIVAVTRIETRGAKLTADQRIQAAAAIAATAKRPGTRAVQIDFDALQSERGFYRDLLKDARAQLPPGMPLSITALASWCYYDDWISGLPVDEAVPMLFRLGVDEREIRARLAANEDFHEPLCRTSLGVSTDESLAHLPAGRRVYVFHPRPWSNAAFNKVVKDLP